MASWDHYPTVEAFYQGIQAGQIDVSKLTAHIDCGDFFVLDEHEAEIISGDEREILPLFFKVLGIKAVDA